MLTRVPQALVVLAVSMCTAEQCRGQPACLPANQWGTELGLGCCWGSQGLG